VSYILRRQRSVRECRRCCDPGEDPPSGYGGPSYPGVHPAQYQVVPQINITILKGAVNSMLSLHKQTHAHTHTHLVFTAEEVHGEASGGVSPDRLGK